VTHDNIVAVRFTCPPNFHWRVAQNSRMNATATKFATCGALIYLRVVYDKNLAMSTKRPLTLLLVLSKIRKVKPLKIRAPGRINLIGEHTDYNSGFVLPCAINREITIRGKERKDKKVVLHSLDFGEKIEIDLKKSFSPRGDWADYPLGVIKEYLEKGFFLSGMELEISGNIPIGAGLSSSAALEVATALFIKTLNNLKIEKTELALLCQKAENSFVGVSCGIMDQFASLFSKKGFALFLDCRNLSYSYVPLPFSGYKIILADTKKKHRLTSSFYNQRRKECRQAAKLLSEEAKKKKLLEIKSLRDTSPEIFQELKGSLSQVLGKRAKHVVEENERTERAVEALKKNDLISFGNLLYASHNSLRDLYEVSCPELNLLVEEGKKMPGVLGARMTGAGFGGCTINLVKEETTDKFQEKISLSFSAAFGHRPDFYLCETTDGASFKTTR